MDNYFPKFLDVRDKNAVAEFLGSPVALSSLGIEITIKEIADDCGLGNIDPQHGFARGNDTKARSAIEAALHWPLPPKGTHLITIRPDPDALGAMAILELRCNGHNFAPPELSRIEAIIKGDRFDYGAWLDWAKANPLPQNKKDMLSLSGHCREFRALGALCFSKDIAIENKIQSVGEWIKTGFLPNSFYDEIDRVDNAATAAYFSGALSVSTYLGDRVAVVKGDDHGLLWLGYRKAPIVVAIGQVNGLRKFTIGQFSEGFLDFGLLTEELNRYESGWGGSKTIIGSNQSQSCAMEIATIIEIIAKLI